MVVVGWMQHNEEMGVVAFSWPFAAAALCFSARKDCWNRMMRLRSDWAGWVSGRGRAAGVVQGSGPETQVVTSGTMMREAAGCLLSGGNRPFSGGSERLCNVMHYSRWELFYLHR